MLKSRGQDDLLRGIHIELSASRKIILNVKLKVLPDDRRTVNTVSGLAVLGKVQSADQGKGFFSSSWHWNRYPQRLGNLSL